MDTAYNTKVVRVRRKARRWGRRLVIARGAVANDNLGGAMLLRDGVVELGGKFEANLDEIEAHLDEVADELLIARSRRSAPAMVDRVDTQPAA